VVGGLACPLPVRLSGATGPRARGSWVQVGLPPVWSWGYLGQQPGAVRPASITQPVEPIPLPPSRAEPLGPPTLGAAPGLGAQLTLPAPQQPPPDSEILTLGDLEQIALMNNPSLTRAQALVAAARGN